MKNLKAKILSIALATTLIIGNSAVLADGFDDIDTTVISVGDKLDVDLPAGTDGQWFEFTPTESGAYYVYSLANNGDPVVELYNSNHESLASNDDGSGFNNFGLQYTLTAGQTYYIWAYKYSKSYPASYKISIAKYEDVEGLSVNFGHSDNYYSITETDNNTYLYVPIGESIDLSVTGTDSFTPYFGWYNYDISPSQVLLSTGNDYTFECTESGRHQIIAGCGNKIHYYVIIGRDIPTTYVNGAEKSYDSYISVTWPNEQGGGDEPRVGLRSTEPVQNTGTVNVPLVTSSFLTGTPVTIGIGEIEGAQYQWYDLSDTSNPTAIDGADGIEMVCDDLELGTHRFGILINNSSDYIPVAFEITITESTPEPEVPADTTTYVAPPSDNHNDIDSFVERFYVYALGRNSDPAGKAYWSGRLMEDGFSGTELARGFLYSQEFVNKNLSNEDYVTVLYATFLGRTPDAVGFDYWVSRLENGASRDDVFLGFAYSPEFGELCARYGIVR